MIVNCLLLFRGQLDFHNIKLKSGVCEKPVMLKETRRRKEEAPNGLRYKLQFRLLTGIIKRRIKIVNLYV